MISNTSERCENQEVEALSRGIVLIVSSDQEFREHYRSLLLEWGFTPLTATTYPAATACLRLVVVTLVLVDQGSLAIEARNFMDCMRQMELHPLVIVVRRSHNPGFVREDFVQGTAEHAEHPVAIPDILRMLDSPLQPSAGTV